MLSWHALYCRISMKSIIVLLSVIIFLSACNGNGASNNNMVYGAPEAKVSTAPNNQRDLIGPLAYGPAVPEITDGDTVVVKMDAKHKIYQIASGVLYQAWTFGDSIPGPVLRVRVGQTVKFSMTDRSNDTMNMRMYMNSMPMQYMPHSMDFHASMVNPEDKFRSINPGETIEFIWTANYPGVFMYHCATPSVLVHMANGMVGMVIVEPANGYPGDDADYEYAIVQNEYYAKPGTGNIHILDTQAARQRQPTHVTFNGRAGQYVAKPLKAKAGSRVRMYVLNVGPSMFSSFHVIGTILDKVWLDGNPENELVGMQSVTLGPGSGAIVEFVMPEEGLYHFVDHSFANAEMGAVGTIKAEKASD